MLRNVIERLYIKTGLRTSASITDFPPFGSAGQYPSGHQFADRNTGALYRNIGSLADSMHVDGFANYLLLTEQFLQKPSLKADLDTFTSSVAAAELVKAMQANKNFSLIGTNAVDADAVLLAGGGVSIATHGASADSSIILPSLSTSQTSWSAVTWKANKRPRFEAVVQTDSGALSTTIWAGFKLTNTPVTITDDDQAFFRVNTGTTLINGTNTSKWQCIDSTGGTDNAQDSGISIAVSTQYHLLIQVDGSRIPHYYINGQLVATGAALTTNVTMIPYIGILSGASAVKTLSVRALRCGQTYVD